MPLKFLTKVKLKTNSQKELPDVKEILNFYITSKRYRCFVVMWSGKTRLEKN
jgi:hypothetical protein